VFRQLTRPVLQDTLGVATSKLVVLTKLGWFFLKCSLNGIRTERWTKRSALLRSTVEPLIYHSHEWFINGYELYMNDLGTILERSLDLYIPFFEQFMKRLWSLIDRSLIVLIPFLVLSYTVYLLLLYRSYPLIYRSNRSRPFILIKTVHIPFDRWYTVLRPLIDRSNRWNTFKICSVLLKIDQWFKKKFFQRSGLGFGRTEQSNEWNGLGPQKTRASLDFLLLY
jgi:hypothetical protein